MTITVLAPAFYDNPEWSTRYLRISAERHGVPIRWYGVGELYRGWIYVQIERLIEELERVDTSHVLYTDSSDVILLSNLDEIEDKYMFDYRNPEMLISVEADGVNAGGWMGRTGDAIDTLKWLADWTFDGDDGNPQTRWREAIADGEIDVERDVARHIFFVTGSPYGVADGRITYHDPSIKELGYEGIGFRPCVLHFAGGYTDPKVGKAALIEPVWRELRYEGTVEL